MIAALFSALVLSALALSSRRGQADDDHSDNSESKVQRGFAIAPVQLDLDGKNPSLVGLGSYIVNSQGGCNDCHTCPAYVGHSAADNPFVSGGSLSDITKPGPVNKSNYLAGGVHFGPFVSKNLTPDPQQGNRPEGLTLAEFMTVMKTGHDPDQPGHILQVMPWPVYRHMTDHDLLAIYEYLSAIPPAQPGMCSGAGEFQVRP
jgi:hypothetical protein